MRPTWAEINLKALSQNYLRCTEIVGEKVRVMAVVKADAYGHGAVEVSKALLACGCDMFGVATIDEGLELRQAGINASIVLLSGISPDEIKKAIENDLTPVVFSTDLLKELDKYAFKNNKRIRYHLKIDTGMNRLGLLGDKFDEYILEILSLNNVVMEGIFTHLSSADCDNAYTLKQLSVFTDVCSVLHEKGLRPSFYHSANSAAIQRFKDSHHNLVRPGIMIYGASAADDIYLHPVMKLKTKIVQIKEIPKGSKVSYGGTFITKRPTKIAVLPIGYADGYSRHLSNKGVVSLHNTTAPVIGRVCMDLIIVDITDIENVKTGDELVLFGDGLVGVDQIASLAGTISYELLSIVGKRVQRVYYS